MGVFNFLKSGAQKRTEKKTKQTKGAIGAVQARRSIMSGGAKAGLSMKASQDVATHPDSKKGPPRTTTVGNYR